MTFIILIILAIGVFIGYDRFRIWHNNGSVNSDKLPSRVALSVPSIVIGVCIMLSLSIVVDLSMSRFFHEPSSRLRLDSGLVFDQAASYPRFLKIIKPDTQSLNHDNPVGLHRRVNTIALVVHGTAGLGLETITKYHDKKWGHQGYHIIILKNGKVSCPIDPNSLTVSYGITPGNTILRDSLVSLNNGNVINLAFETSLTPSTKATLTSEQISSYKLVWGQVVQRYPWISVTFHKFINNTLCPNLDARDVVLLRALSTSK